MAHLKGSIASALKGIPLGGYIENTATTSLNQGVTASVDRIKVIINDIINNFDFNRLLDIAKRSLDWHTYIDLTPSPRGPGGTNSSGPSTSLSQTRRIIDTGVNILFEVNEQYPNELRLLVIIGFMLAPLGMALCLLIFQGWDTGW